MQSHDMRLLGGAAIPTVVAGLVAVLISLGLAGAKGAIGAAIALAVVTAFFTISLLAVSYASKISPMAMMPAALISYTVKLIGMFVLVAMLSDVTAWNPRAFAWTVICLTMVWLAGEARVWMKDRVLFLDPPTGRSP